MSRIHVTIIAGFAGMSRRKALKVMEETAPLETPPKNIQQTAPLEMSPASPTWAGAPAHIVAIAATAAYH